MATGELLEIYAEDGTPLGTKDRDQAHLDGDWHRTAQVWALLTGTPAGPALLLAQRTRGKYTWPGLWGATAGGHLAPGETGADAARREAYEETGRDPGPGTLLALGTARVQDLPGSPGDPGGEDRELRAFYLWPVTLPEAASLRPDEGEASLILAIGLADLAALAAGRGGPAPAWPPGGWPPRALCRADLLPSWTYLGAVCRGMYAYLRGETRGLEFVSERLTRPARRA